MTTATQASIDFDALRRSAEDYERCVAAEAAARRDLRAARTRTAEALAQLRTLARGDTSQPELQLHRDG